MTKRRLEILKHFPVFPSENYNFRISQVILERVLTSTQTSRYECPYIFAILPGWLEGILLQYNTPLSLKNHVIFNSKRIQL